MCGGRCAYDDLHLALRQLRRATSGAVQRCLLIDLDVHQVRRLCALPSSLPVFAGLSRHHLGAKGRRQCAGGGLSKLMARGLAGDTCESTLKA